MGFTNYSNSTSDEHILVIPNPNLDVIQNVIFTLLSILLVVLGLSSNVFLIVSLAKKSSVPICNHLIINLCLADSVKSCLHFIIYVTSAPMNSWFLGWLTCKVLPNILEGYQTYSIFILAILARYYYYAISKPLELVKKKKWKIYVELSIFYVYSIWAATYNGYGRNYLCYIQDATRCCKDLSLIDKNPDNITVTYFFFITLTHIQQVYYFSRIAYTLWKNAKRLGDDILESSQRLKRNKKAAKTIFVMVMAYDFVVLPIAILKSIALYYTHLSSLRELASLFLLIYCSFNPLFYIWRDETLRKTVMQYFAKLFCRH